VGGEAGRQEGVRAVMFQEAEDSLIERLRLKEPAQKGFVAFQQALPSHLGHKVKGTSIHGGVTVTVLEEASFGLQAPIQAGAGGGGQQVDHGGGDGGFFDKIRLIIEDVGGVRVKAHDETTADFNAMSLDGPYGLHQVAVQVLALITSL
jgi:hypothetical protein